MIQRAAGVVERKQAVKRYQFFSTVSWNGSMFPRKNWSASVMQPPSQIHLCIKQYHHAYRQYCWYDTIVSPTPTIVQEALWQFVIILCSFFFFIGQSNSFFFFLYFYYFSSRVRWLQGKKHHRCPRSLTNEQWWQEKILKLNHLAANLT